VIFRRRPAVVRREQSLGNLDLNGVRISYLLKRSSARRGLALRVNSEGMAQVNAPWAMPQAKIDEFLCRHASWLHTQMAKRRTTPIWVDGLAVPFMGKELQLAWRPDANRKSVRQEGELLVCEVSEIYLQNVVVDWFRAQAERHFADRLELICARLQQPVPQWRLSNARTRWGSLSAKGVVSLNWRLIKAGPAVIDYVICHELAHFRYRDHSAAFWREVAAIYPDYPAMRQRLHLHGVRYLEF
jgi:hypothetical protein